MTAVSKQLKKSKTRPWKFLCLVFFVCSAIYSCSGRRETAPAITWQNDKATAVRFSNNLLTTVHAESLADLVKICLADDPDSTAILGSFKNGDLIIFQPVIPFSHGSSYSIFFRAEYIGGFSVPEVAAYKQNTSVSFYPQQDVLPVNLLKMYIAFSRPMSEGQSGKYILVLKNQQDTVPNVLLNLQPELWNEDRTVLTVWFDPGRIKRDLQPNQKLGTPLQEKAAYALTVSRLWKDAEGVALENDFTKTFITGARDSLSPVTENWKLELPTKYSSEPLIVIPDEPLDHFLFNETLRVKDELGFQVKGSFEIVDKDTKCRFIPASPWQAGNYSLATEARLEDFAGNNLNRPFDRDITTTKTPGKKVEYVVNFSIQ